MVLYTAADTYTATREDAKGYLCFACCRGSVCRDGCGTSPAIKSLDAGAVGSGVPEAVASLSGRKSQTCYEHRHLDSTVSF